MRAEEEAKEKKRLAKLAPKQPRKKKDVEMDMVKEEDPCSTKIAINLGSPTKEKKQ